LFETCTDQGPTCSHPELLPHHDPQVLRSRTRTACGRGLILILARVADVSRVMIPLL